MVYWKSRLITNRASYCGDYSGGACTFGSLNTKLSRLPRLDAGIPTEIGCGVRVASSQGRIPAAYDLRSIRITPFHIPTVDCAGAAVDDANSAGETRVPLIANNVNAFATGVRNRRTGFAGRYCT